MTEAEKYEEASLPCNRCVSERLSQIIGDIKPSHVFTCIDIFDALLEFPHTTIGDNKGVYYKTRRKNKWKRVYMISINNFSFIAYEIYHPAYYGATFA